MKFEIGNVKPGMVTADAIMKENNPTIILNANVTLTEKMIEALKKNGIKYIDIALTKEQQCAYVIKKGVNNTISSKLEEDAKNSIKNFNTSKIIQNAQLMISSILESDSFEYDLAKYKIPSDIFAHSVRTASFAIILAKFYNDSLNSFILDNTVLKKCTINLESIAVAAMLHDIGKLCKDKTILEKILKTNNSLSKFFPGIKDINLENYDENYSSIYSYLLLNQNSLLKPDIKMMVLLSNETENGKGPLKPSEQYLKSRQNFIFGSKIIKLCSIYDDELNKMISSNEPLENISSKLDYLAVNDIVNDELEKLFITHIPLYSKGIKIKLSDGRFAVVEESFHNRMYICRPIVRTIPDNEIIDLRQEYTITIKEICSDEVSFMDLVNRQIQDMEQELSSKKSL
jgi:hypothetical protein